MQKCQIRLSAKKPPIWAYPKELVTIGDHIRKRRLDLKLLKRDIAETLRVDTMTVNNWERNRCRPRLYLIPEIVQLLGYNPFAVIETPTLSPAIKAYRLMHGLSQRNLAKHLAIDPTTMAKSERGKSTPGRKLKEQLNALIDYRRSDNNDGA